MLKAKYPVVLVRWVDAAMSAAPHWQESNVPKPPKGRALHLCHTVGWLVFSDDDWLQVVSTLTNGAHAHVTEIPAGMVREMKELLPPSS